MNMRIFGTVCAAALGIFCGASLALAETPETKVPISGPGAKPGLPGWYIEGSAADPLGPFPPGRGQGAGAGRGGAGRGGAGRGPAPVVAANPMPPGSNGVPPDWAPPPCAHSIVCASPGTEFGGVTDGVTRVAWKPTTKWTYSYPFEVLPGGGDVSGAGVDSKDNVWVWERNLPGQPALFKFGPDHKLLFTVDPALTDQTQPFRGHGMCVDANDDAWVINEIGEVVKEFSPDGKLLRTLGTKGHRGDWDESKGQRLLWDPVTCGFGPNGDIYIFEGHGDESPNDVGSDDPTNVVGVARVLHLDKNANFINQWYGNAKGPAKFNNAHGSAVDPVTGDVWVGDREDDRITIYTANGHYLRTLQMRNLICALYFDNHPGPRFGQLWLGTGMDGQVVRIDRNNGNVLEVAGGNRKGLGDGQFSEATNMGSDSHGNLVVGDTQHPRATLLTPPARKAAARR